MLAHTTVTAQHTCYHCGDSCKGQPIIANNLHFCCNGCLNVYQIINSNNLANYYCLNEAPGLKTVEVSEEKYHFLEDESIAKKFITFSNTQQQQAQLHLPQIHCSSCLWLLEHLDTLHPAILFSKVNFTEKTIIVTYKSPQLTLRKLVEMLASIGYEPLIDAYRNENEASKIIRNRTQYIKLAVAGFCFTNIMLISFPEYLGLEMSNNPLLLKFFRYINLLLSIPVIFYSGIEFFKNAFYSYRQKYFNIDAPIALALAITFCRSIYEIITATGGGYLDSMSGIVFFMLLGRLLQNRSHTTLQFNRDHRSYFPIAVKKRGATGSQTVKLEDIKENDILLIHRNEVLPVDCLLSKGKAQIDYSFITGEAQPEKVSAGNIIYAGGKNVGEALEVVAVKTYSQNIFSTLWNNHAQKQQQAGKGIFTAVVSKYFAISVILIALGTFAYWYSINSTLAWQAATAVLIIACPCALLLTSTFTNGYILQALAAKGLFIKNETVIEAMAKCRHIAFDKTGTITQAGIQNLSVQLDDCNDEERKMALNMMAQSTHPLSKALVNYYGYEYRYLPSLSIKEIPGRGLEAWHDNNYYKLGSRKLVTGEEQIAGNTEVLFSINGIVKAVWQFDVQLIDGGKSMLATLAGSHTLSLTSGDNNAAEIELGKIFPQGSPLLFNCSVSDKIEHIKNMQSRYNHVIMVGDGLNDAGALQQSNVGMAVAKDSFSFNPACDAIIEAQKIIYLPAFIAIARQCRRLIVGGFIYSLIFNVVGISLAVTGHITPMVAAILMPASSLGIILIAYLGVRKTCKKHFS